MSSQMKAATHNGSFHGDDVTGAAILKTRFPEIDITRTRDPNVLAASDILFDVGGEYSPDLGRFDHHQKGGAGTRENGVPFASAGLLWSEYGLDIVNLVAKDWNVPFTDLVARVDKRLIQLIDAHDCGDLSGEPPKTSSGVTLELTLPILIENLNPPNSAPPSEFDQAFSKATNFVRFALHQVILREAEKLHALTEIRSVWDGGPILELKTNLPWHEVVVNELPEVRFVIAPKTDQFNLSTVPLKVGGFTHRALLPGEWAGLKGDALREATGVSDAEFCHQGRFIAVAKSLEGIRSLSKLAIENINAQIDNAHQE